MARAMNPLMSEKAKGSVSGLTYADWKGMGVVRRKPRPARRMRTTQPRNRSLLGFLSREYGTLTSGQRNLWETYALNHPHDDGWGGTFILSGHNAYVMLNHTACRLGLIAGLQVTPPTEPPGGGIESFTAVTGAVNPGEIDLDWVLMGQPSADDFIEIREAGPFQSPARQEVHSRFRTILKPAGTAVDATVEDLIVDTWYWFLLRYVDEYGQTTAWFTAQATPLAP